MMYNIYFQLSYPNVIEITWKNNQNHVERQNKKAK